MEMKKQEENMEAKKNAQQTMKELLYELNLYKSSTMAKSVGLTYNSIYSIEKGKRKKFSVKITDAICGRFPQVNRDRLLTGEGDLFNDVNQ